MAIYKVISVTGTNEAIIIAAPAQLDGWYFVNSVPVMRYVKLWDSATLPNIAVTGQKLTFGVPAYGASNVALNSPLTFGAGITIAIVAGLEIGNVGPVTADDIAVNFYYE